MPSPSLEIIFCWRRWQILLLSCKVLSSASIHLPQGAELQWGRQRWLLCGNILAGGSAVGGWGRAAAPQQCLLRGLMSTGTGKAFPCLLPGRLSTGWQPPTPTGTCNAKPGTLLSMIRKSKVPEGTLTYFPDQLGLLFMNILYNQNHYSIQLFLLFLSFWVFFNTTRPQILKNSFLSLESRGVHSWSMVLSTL